MGSKVLVLLTLACIASASTVGMKAGLSISSVNDFKDAILPVVLQELSDTTFQEIHESFGQGFYRVNIDVTRIRFEDFGLNLTETYASLWPPDVIKFQTGQLKGHLSFRWAYSGGLGGDNGEGSIILAPSDFVLQLQVWNQDGKPAVKIQTLLISISDLTIELANSPIAPVANWLINVFKDRILGLINTQLSQVAVGAVNKQLALIFQHMSPVIPIEGSPLMLVYNLTDDPIVTQKYIQYNSIGTFIDTLHPTQEIKVAPPTALPDFDADGDQAQVYLSEYTLNTGMFCAYTAGILKGNVTSEQTKGLPIQLNTSSLRNIFPGLVKKYGENKPCDLNFDATGDPPVLKTTGGVDPTQSQITGNITTFCDLIVVGEGTAVVLLMEIYFEMNAYMADWTVKGELKDIEVSKLSVVKNNLDGKIDVKEMKSALTVILQGAILFINQMIFKSGLPLPSNPFVNMTDAVFTVNTGYLEALATPTYNFKQDLQEVHMLR